MAGRGDPKAFRAGRRVRHRAAAAGLALAATILVHACGESPTGLSRDRAPEIGFPEALLSIAPDKVCGEATPVDLIGNAGGRLGTVTVSNDDDEITVVYATSGDWELDETHLSVASSVDGIPTSPSGSPQVGRFPYTARHAPGTTTFAVTIAIDALGLQADDAFVVAAHADVIDRMDTNGRGDDRRESAWGDGTPFPRRGQGEAGSYFEQVVRRCTEVTQTIGEEGGTIDVEGESPGEGVTLVIPPGALVEPTDIEVRAVPLSAIGIPGSASLGLEDLIEGTAYDFGPDGLQFLEPVQIIIGYGESSVDPENEAALSVFRIDADIERIPSTVNEAANEVTALIHHFTFFAAGTEEVPEHLIREAIGVTDRVTVDVRSPGRARVAEAIGVTDQVTIAVRGAIRSDIAELVAVTDDVTIDVRSPIRPDVAETVAVADAVTVTVRPTGPAGTLVFSSDRNTGSLGQLFTKDLGLSTVTRITDLVNFTDAAWSPDGTRIAAIRGNGLWIMDADGGNAVEFNLLNSADIVAIGNPSWSPDGLKIVLHGVFDFDAQQDFDLWVFDVATTGVTRLTNNAVDDEFPDWSPLGSSILYAVDRTELWTIEPSGANPLQRLSGVGVLHPDWAPDGVRVAFTRPRAAGSSIDILAIDDPTDITTLVDDGRGNVKPAWSPDGLFIGFAKDQIDDDEAFDLYFIPADGTGGDQVLEAIINFSTFDVDWK